MAGMRHNVPGEFNSETKWFRFFSNKQLAFLVVALFVLYLCYKVSVNFTGRGFFGVLVGLIIGAVIVAPSMIPIPQTEFLKGGGLTIDIILIRRWIRKRKKCIYVKGWKKD